MSVRVLGRFSGTWLLVVVGEPFGEARLAQARVRAGRDRGVGQFGAEVAGMLLAYDLSRVVVGGKYATDQLGELDFLALRVEVGSER
jgi:hypothetical protein